jgi:hypothetical protein
MYTGHSGEKSGFVRLFVSHGGEKRGCTWVTVE